ncbi:NlpC/P60 family protein [Curtobacterium sp. MCBD17_040]|uniref:C40 family peptidase n=1 Tax=Curtobacterium sp. MCBD17_040 TaxID=2175674 RepID=UPI0011B3F1C8|nr:NlpC/P60 family protein [Curtobacterium sp. MCBD17_040]WIB65498.1 NlpC/P60 family protein [Curtobacterium sp. MCBD17_040]
MQRPQGFDDTADGGAAQQQSPAQQHQRQPTAPGGGPRRPGLLGQGASAGLGAVGRAVGGRTPGRSRFASIRDTASTFGSSAPSTSAQAASGAEQAKDFAKDAVKEIAKGALTGGYAGAAKGAFKAIIRNKWAMTTIGFIVVAIIAGPALLIGAVAMSASTAKNAANAHANDVAVATAVASGQTDDAVAKAQADTAQSNIPWQIWLAYTDNGGQTQDTAGNSMLDDLSSALAKQDGHTSDWDLLNGAELVENSSSEYKLSTDSDDKQAQATTEKLYDAVLQNPGALPAATADTVFTTARSWALGLVSACSSNGSASASGDGAPQATGVPAERAPVDKNPGGTLTTLAPGQVNNARAIIGIAKTIFAKSSEDDQKQAALIGLITALVESNIENLDFGDRDSIGAFQQRDTWGTETERTSIYYSSSAFFNRLIAKKTWATGEPGAVAQSVQISGYPDRYAQKEGIGREILAAYWDGVDPIAEPNPPGPPVTVTDGHGHALAGSTTTSSSSGTSGSSGGADSVSSCTVSSSFTGGSVGTNDPGPDHPGPGATSSGAQANGEEVAAALAFAGQQLGKPYQLGGAGPDVWDCSGLVMVSYGTAGVGVGMKDGVPQHDSHKQFSLAKSDQVFPYSQRERGDLLFWGRPNTSIYHVGFYLGQDAKGQDWMLAAPKEGDVVKIQPVWGGPAGQGDLMDKVVRPTVDPFKAAGK